ncbi:MORC family CW-type zinc finger protein 3 [Morella rubra]|uniref:MORC family CW-type zinc finger protein 3 n=1 Tax=Morella rubra TaxID=262757 RepID=A0A6A1W3W0_9ROSI|nr:MORC family CW-type zinc finger protein 3 [Morella rubra]
MDPRVKHEFPDVSPSSLPTRTGGDVPTGPVSYIELSSSSDSGEDNDAVSRKRPRVLKQEREPNSLGLVVPPGFHQALSPAGGQVALALPQPNAGGGGSIVSGQNSCKQFWKAGDYEGSPCGEWSSSSVGLDHVRVHPRFLHSNATSHKWALGAFAELLDNSLDEVCSGATYVDIDMLVNKKDGSRMLLIEDNGGGMDPDKMRQCMSLGYSAKSKLANTIGQYGNGFKTSTMRLGADVIVFSRCSGKEGKSPTQSIGLLSYTFLRSTGKEDIVVPMLDFERRGGEWNKIRRYSPVDWSKNVETIVNWSPFSSEEHLLQQFNLMRNHGTRIIIYNLWEDDQGLLELDFDADPHDIQIRGVNRDEKNIQMAKEYPNSRHFLTYRHSLRICLESKKYCLKRWEIEGYGKSYVSILYLRLPPGFRIILRGKDVEHHNIVNDMMLSQEVTYRPNPGADAASKNLSMVAVVTIGFVKDAKHHIDVQGFNVYHKNRLIKLAKRSGKNKIKDETIFCFLFGFCVMEVFVSCPFWRLWNAAGSDGRGVIGVLEANFVEPAHDKQGFERTTVLARLEARLKEMQKNYWSSNCHRIGYAARRNKKLDEAEEIEDASDEDTHIDLPEQQVNGNGYKTSQSMKSFGKDGLHTARTSSCMGDIEAQQDCASGGKNFQTSTQSPSKGGDVNGSANSLTDAELRTLEQLKEENHELRKRLEKKEGEFSELLCDLEHERDKRKSLEMQVPTFPIYLWYHALQTAQEKIEELNREQESLIDIFAEERDRRDNEEKNLKKKLQEANNIVQEFRDRIRNEKM